MYDIAILLIFYLVVWSFSVPYPGFEVLIYDFVLFVFLFFKDLVL